MNPSDWVIPLLGGLLAGVIFFGGLWWTVSRGLKSPLAPLWFLVSLLVRMSVTIVAFIVLSAGRWDRLLACLAGFVTTRCVVFAIMRNDSTSAPPCQKGASCG